METPKAHRTKIIYFNGENTQKNLVLVCDKCIITPNYIVIMSLPITYELIVDLLYLY